MKTPSILIVEDEVLAAESLRFTLEDLGYDVVGDICLDGREAVSFLVRMKECIENPERILINV